MSQNELRIYDSYVYMFYVKYGKEIDIYIDLPMIIKEYIDDYDNIFKGKYVCDLIYEIFDNIMFEATYRAMVKVCGSQDLLDKYVEKFNKVIVDDAMDNYICELHYNVRESFEEYLKNNELESPLDYSDLRKLLLFSFDYVRIEMIKYHENLLKQFNLLNTI